MLATTFRPVLDFRRKSTRHMRLNRPQVEEKTAFQYYSVRIRDVSLVPDIIPTSTVM